MARTGAVLLRVDPARSERRSREAGRDLVYWGQVPVEARIGATEFRTATFPYGEGFVLPLRVAIRRAEEIEVGDVLRVALRLRSR